MQSDFAALECGAVSDKTLYSEAGTPPLMQIKEPVQTDTLKVLVIDDNKPYASGLAELLELGGFDASFVLTGLEGIESAYRLGVDAVILDMNLPDMNGFEVCRRLRRDPKTAHIAVVFHTTKGSVPGARHEADAFLGFPIPMSEVYTVIRDCVEKRRSRYLG